MKKNIILYYILVAFVFIFIFIVIFERPKKFISRLIFSHELSLLTHSVFNEINNQIDFDMTKKENNKKSLIILNNYVFDFFKPVFNNLDDGASWKMLHGSIWCDGVADIFLRLAENTNTRVAMVILYDNEKNPLHALNFADLDNSVNNFDENSELNKMYLFDPQNNYFPINNKFDFVNVIYMIKNKIEFSGYDMLDSNNIKLNLLENNKKVFHKNRTFKEYSTIGKLSLKIVTIFPPIIFKTIYKFGIYINP